MPDHHESPATYRVGYSRRSFLGTTIGATVGALSLSVLPARLLAASASANASISQDALYALSQQLVGSDDIDRNMVAQLAQLLASKPQLESGAAELADLDDPASDKAQASLSNNGHSACTNILNYWFKGYFDGQPVAQRSDIFFSLPVWATVDYMTQPTMCKGFGYWAQDVTDNISTAGAPA